MAVYVDELRVWPHAKPPFTGGSCHLFADTREDLEAFARQMSRYPSLGDAWAKGRAFGEADPKHVAYAHQIGTWLGWGKARLGPGWQGIVDRFNDLPPDLKVVAMRAERAEKTRIHGSVLAAGAGYAAGRVAPSPLAGSYALLGSERSKTLCQPREERGVPCKERDVFGRTRQDETDQKNAFSAVFSMGVASQRRETLLAANQLRSSKAASKKGRWNAQRFLGIAHKPTGPRGSLRNELDRRVASALLASPWRLQERGRPASSLFSLSTLEDGEPLPLNIRISIYRLYLGSAIEVVEDVHGDRWLMLLKPTRLQVRPSWRRVF